jgi:hypothetical protein
MNGLRDWVKEYPWIVLIAVLACVVMFLVLRQVSGVEERMNRFELAKTTLMTAQDLADSTHVRDSIFYAGDTLRLHNQILILRNQLVIEAKLDSVLKALR